MDKRNSYAKRNGCQKLRSLIYSVREIKNLETQKAMR